MLFMGIFDFFKKLIKNEKKEELKNKKIILSELGILIESNVQADVFFKCSKTASCPLECNVSFGKPF